MIKSCTLIFSLLFSCSCFAQMNSDTSMLICKLVIEFNSDEHSIDGVQLESLDAFISSNTSYYYMIEAHTDSDGSDEYNLKLSKRRCEAVRNHLLEKEVDTLNIISNYFGETLPLVKEYNETIKRKNRRVVLEKYEIITTGEMSGRIINDETEKPIVGRIKLSSPSINTSVKSNERGEFSLTVPLDQDIQIDIIAKGHFINTKKLKLSKKSKINNIVFRLKEFELNDKYHLNHVNFIGNTSVLLKKSYPSLEALKQFMEVNEETCVELAGHINMPNTPPLPRYTESFGLSIARAITIHDTLINNGVSEDRILARGYGNTFMLYPEAKTQEEQSDNRRVELVISSCDSTSIIRNDSLYDISIYHYPSPMDRKLNKQTMVRDMSGLPQRLKEEIIDAIKELDSNKKDPTRFTYKDLLLYNRREK